MEYICHYRSPLGGITLTADEGALTGLCFDGEWKETNPSGTTRPESMFTAPGQAGRTKSVVPVSPGARRTELMAPEPWRSGQSEPMVPALKDGVRWLDLYFSGKEPDFIPRFRLDGTAFREMVWEILLTIPYGQTLTYAQIAAKIAAERGLERMPARAVGSAVGHNLILLIIPCHRVIGSDGSLTGYSGGIDRKRRLLLLEGIGGNVCHLA